MPRSRLIIALLLVLTACAGPSATTTTNAPTTTAPQTSSIADSYIDEALEIMKTESLWSPVADWDLIEESMRTEAEGALVEEETYRAIELGLRLLGDEIGFFITPEDVLVFSAEPPVVEPSLVEVREDRIGYVAAGQFRGDRSPEADAFSAELAGQIVDTEPDVCGWILDLGITRFGNPEPVLVGLAPLLDRGVVGGISKTNDRFDELENTGSSILIGGELVGENSVTAVPEQNKPIAIIIGSLTGSPGEIAAIAFRGQENVELFGQPTAGFGLWGDAFELSDGASIALGTGKPTDRLGNAAEGGFPIFPDNQTANPLESEQAAIEWLTTHPSCQ